MNIITDGYKFSVNSEGKIEVYNAEGSESSPAPIFIANNGPVNSTKEFEVEVSYILNDHLNNANNDSI